MGDMVKIKVHVVYGESSTVVCLSKTEAKLVSTSLGGWGEIKEEERFAELVETVDNNADFFSQEYGS